MKGRNKVEWLEELLRGKKSKTHPDRSYEQSALLSMAPAKMEANRVRLQIPQRDITIIRYLADNPRAVIIADANVTRAFQHAKQAVEF